MDSQFNEIELFEGKNMSDLFKEIYENQRTKKQQIKDLVEQLYPLIEGLGDATLLVPLIKEYMEIGVKNDEQLIKLAQIVQRVEVSKKAGNSTGFDFSSLQDLIDEDSRIQQEVSDIKESADKITKNGKSE